MILCNVIETQQDETVVLRRKLSQCMISGEHIIKVEITVAEE